MKTKLLLFVTFVTFCESVFAQDIGTTALGRLVVTNHTAKPTLRVDQATATNDPVVVYNNAALVTSISTGGVLTASSATLASANVSGTVTGATVTATSGNISGTLTGATVIATSANITGTVTGATVTATSGNISGTLTGATVTATSGNISGTVTGATAVVTTANIGSANVSGTLTGATVVATSANITGTVTGATVTATSGNISGTVTGATLRATSANITGTATGAIFIATSANITGTVTGATVIATSANITGTITGAVLNASSASLTSSTASTVASLVKGQNSQTTNLFEIRDSAGNLAFGVNTNGFSTFPASPKYGNSTNNGSTDLYYPLGSMTCTSPSTGGTVMTNGNIRLTPFYSGMGGLIDSLAFKVVTPVASTTNRLGIYKSIDDRTNIYPGALLVDAGNFDTSGSGTKITNLVTAVRLEPGRIYWAATQANGAILLTAQGVALVAPILGMDTNFNAFSALECVTTYGAGNAGLPANLPTTTLLRAGAGGTFANLVAARFSLPIPETK